MESCNRRQYPSPGTLSSYINGDSDRLLSYDSASLFIVDYQVRVSVGKGGEKVSYRVDVERGRDFCSLIRWMGYVRK